LLDLLAERPHSVEELAAHFDMRRPSVSDHLKVLEDSGLVHEHPFERFWRERLRALSDLLDEQHP
jgi:DNA-binding transcriptional ArsR family regulator